MIKIYRRRQREAKQEVGRKRGLASQRVQKTKRSVQSADADTLRSRLNYDSRGQIKREGCAYSAVKVEPWQVCHAVAGGKRRFDLIRDGVLIDTCGKRRMRSTHGIHL